MKKRTDQMIPVFSLFIAALLLFFPGGLQAQPGAKLDLKTTVEREVKVMKKGQATVARVAADQTTPGEILVYTIVYSNAGGSAMTKAVIVNPIPQGVVLKPESVEGQDAEVSCSIDNGRSYQPPPIMVRTKKADGSETVEPAPADRYTQVKWVITKPVMPGQSGQVSFKATVK